MDTDSLQQSIIQYKEQLKKINIALECSANEEKDDLLSLKSDIEKLIELTEENLRHLSEKPSTSNDSLDDEYLQFMKEMEAEGVESNVKKKAKENLEDDLKSLEGMKCQAPHTHSWGDVAYHNALICSVLEAESHQFSELKVRVMFTNPTHQEMLPCPYYLEDSNCKFSDEQCRYSHGEVVAFSTLKEYVEPNFEKLKIGSRVLAKSSNKIWNRAIVQRLGTNNCNVKYESNKKEDTVNLKDILPLEESDDNDESSSSCSEEETSETEEVDVDWAVQRSLLNTPSTSMLGDWEKHTKGIGSKLMQQMGYIAGTGLGKHADGRLDPVEAEILPSGKSLDHCMNLREIAGGDKDLFSAERKLKKQQKRQEMLSKKIYDAEKNKKDVFKFLNDTLTLSKSKENVNERINKSEIKTGSNRELNVAHLKLEEEIKRVESEVSRLTESLPRHKPETVMFRNISKQINDKYAQLNHLQDQAKNVKREQTIRKDKKKLTVF